MTTKAGLNQISYLMEQLQRHKIRVNGREVRSENNEDGGPTWASLWRALWKDDPGEGKITEKQYRRYLALCFNPKTRQQLGRELTKLTTQHHERTRESPTDKSTSHTAGPIL